MNKITNVQAAMTEFVDKLAHEFKRKLGNEPYVKAYPAFGQNSWVVEIHTSATQKDVYAVDFLPTVDENGDMYFEAQWMAYYFVEEPK